MLYLIVRLTPRRWLISILITVVFFTAGAYFVYYFSNQRKNSVTNDFFSRAKNISSSINVNSLKAMTPSLSELLTDNYKETKKILENFASIGKNIGIDSIFTVVKKDNQILFILDSTPENQEPSKPGDIYQKPPAELFKVFANNVAVLSNPYTDEWGTYISAFIPIDDPITGQIITVMGFDIDYNLLQKEIKNQSYLIIGITFIIWILFLTVYLYTSILREKSFILKKSSESFSNIITNSMEPIIIIDSSSHIMVWNKSAENLFGYSENEVREKFFNQFALPAKEEFDIMGKLNQVVEVNLTDKKGHIFLAEVSIASVNFRNQAAVFLIIRDISTRKKTEAELATKAVELESTKIAVINVLEDVEKEKARFEALLSGIGDGVVALDQNFRVIFINKIVEEQLGWSTNELIGNDFYNLIKAENNKGEILEKEKRPFYLSLISGNKITTSVSEPNYYIRKDGSKFPVAITVTPVKINDEVVGAIGVFRDITHEIEVDKMKSEFVSLVSHQLRTPLSAMRWYAEMLINGDAGKLTDDQKDFVENIYKSNERMINLVSSLLNISRIESGRIIIEPKPTDLKGLIDEVMSEVKNKFDEKQQTVLISVHPDLGLVNLDPKLIFQVYKNFLTNANKYTPDHGQIEIFVSKKDGDVISRVSDNGYGISAKDQPKIFEKFHRAENILKLETDGTGLGLYLAKAIVESSGGKIGFESEENKGTTFWFSLPIKGIAPKKGEVSITG
jgi:PAS domain S-box-containing protein